MQKVIVLIEHYGSTFCCFEGDSRDNFRGTVQWYWWMIELPKSLQNKATSHYEVFLNRQNYGNEIDLETVLKTHEVTELVQFIPFC